MSGTTTGAGILFYVIILFILFIAQCRSTVHIWQRYQNQRGENKNILGAIIRNLISGDEASEIVVCYHEKTIFVISRQRRIKLTIFR